jgi:Na+-translocating ferredoxin:NAD+ oxidoreductase RNF subunit RnfB
MDLTSILYPAASIGGLGILFGLGLGVAAKKFAVEVDPLVPLVRDALPSANCGGCGYAGCDAFAKAVVEKKAQPNGCPVGGAATAEAICKILGIEVTETAKQVAFVKCNGTCDKAKDKYKYYGITDCKSAAALQGGGPKACEYGCLGFGTCVDVCMFGAIEIVDGVAVVDPEKCTSCGLCASACPKGLIDIVPDASKVRVKCNSQNKGKAVKTSCEVGCIACRMCVKACEFDAIKVENNIAKIDYDKCTQCGACVAKCPTNAIADLMK